MTEHYTRRVRISLAVGLLAVGLFIALTQGYRFTHLREAQQTRETNLATEVVTKTDELQAERRRFGMILEGSPVAVVVCDSQGKITACNAAAQKLFGYGVGEMVGKPSSVLVADSMRPRHIEYMGAAPHKVETNHGKIATQFTGEARKKDGTTFYVKITCAGIMVDGAPEFAAFIKPKDDPDEGS